MKKVVITSLILLIIAATTAVFAKSGTVTTSDLNMRAEASSSGSVIKILDNGTNVEILGEEGNWYKISYDGSTGYVSKDYVTVKEDESIGTVTSEPVISEPVGTGADQADVIINIGDKTKTVKKLNVHALPLINSTKIKTLEEGEEVRVVSSVGKWTYIETSKFSGWVITDGLYGKISTSTNNTTDVNTPSATNDGDNSNTETTDTPQSEETSTSDSNAGYPKTFYVNVDAVNVRKESNTSSDVITSVTRNTDVTVTEEDGDWYKVETSDGNGYIKKDFLTSK